MHTIASRRKPAAGFRLRSLQAAFALALCVGAVAGAAHAQETGTAPKVGTAPAVEAPATAAPATPTGESTATPPAQTPPTSQATAPAVLPSDGGASGGPATNVAPSGGAPATDAEEPVLMDGETAMDATLPHDLSPWGMFMAADWVVKAVMIGLAFASLVTWTVWLAKSLEIAGAKTRLRVVLRTVGSVQTLDDAVGQIGKRGGPGAELIRAAAAEVDLSAGALEQSSADGLKERVASRLSRIQAQAGRRLTKGTGVLATIGSTAPFVGLFGTVWGIMNSFIGISEAQTTNLAVVAPGIAEALLATAIGLVAAIPAVVIYNVFARSITAYRQALADAAAGVERLVSRDIDYRFAPARDRLTLQARPRGAAHAALMRDAAE